MHAVQIWHSKQIDFVVAYTPQSLKGDSHGNYDVNTFSLLSLMTQSVYKIQVQKPQAHQNVFLKHCTSDFKNYHFFILIIVAAIVLVVAVFCHICFYHYYNCHFRSDCSCWCYCLCYGLGPKKTLIPCSP